MSKTINFRYNQVNPTFAIALYRLRLRDKAAGYIAKRYQRRVNSINFLEEIQSLAEISNQKLQNINYRTLFMRQ